LRIDHGMIRSIDTLIDAPHEWAKNLGIGVLERLKENDKCKDIRIIINLAKLNMLPTDWYTQRISEYRIGTSAHWLELLRRTARCIYSDDASLLVDLHVALDMLSKIFSSNMEEFKK